MTQNEYELYQMFQQKPHETEKLIYVGSGEDVCLEMFNQTKEKEQYEAIQS